jgi:hypothetical protein
MVSQKPQQSIPVPALESGDRLTRAEFERRYAATPETFKVELIEGAFTQKEIEIRVNSCD